MLKTLTMHSTSLNHSDLIPLLLIITFLFTMDFKSLYRVQWNPDFSYLQGKRKLVREIGEFEKSGVKLQCLTEERERLLVRVIGRFKNWGFEKSAFHYNSKWLRIASAGLLRRWARCQRTFTDLRCHTGEFNNPLTEILGPKSTFTIRDHFTCMSENLVYPATDAPIFTSVKLGEVSGVDLMSICEAYPTTPGCPVAQHFNSAGHNIKDTDKSYRSVT